MENASFAGEGRTGATSDSPARNGIRRSATPRRRTAPPLRTTGCLNEPESTLPVLAFRLSSPKSARARAHHSEFGSPDSSRVRKPIDLCGSFGRIPSTLGPLRISGRHNPLIYRKNGMTNSLKQTQAANATKNPNIQKSIIVEALYG